MRCSRSCYATTVPNNFPNRLKRVHFVDFFYDNVMISCSVKLRNAKNKFTQISMKKLESALVSNTLWGYVTF